jgi:hypothetical protein
MRAVGGTVTATTAAPLWLNEGPELLLVDFVAESLHAIDLDDRYPLAIPPLERGIGADIDQREVASAHGPDDIDRGAAQMAPRRGVDDDSRHDVCLFSRDRRSRARPPKRR